MKFGFFAKKGGSDFDGVVEESLIAEDLGFDSVWVNDHQATENENYWPAPLQRLTAIATATDRLDLVTGVLILPLYHALHVAQETAMLDVISDGRVTLGVGLGYVPEEFAAFDVPMDDRAGRFVEGVQFLDRFLSSSEPFSFDGQFVSVDDWTPNPVTVQTPRPTLWVGGWGPHQIRRSVTLGDGWVGGVIADLEGIRDRKARQREILEREGGDWNVLAHPLERETVVAETHEEAMELGKTYIHPTYVDEYGSEEWEHPLISSDDVADFERLAEDRFLIGTPAEVAEQIEDLRDQADVDHLGCRFHQSGMSHEQVLRQIELFGDEVLPEFQ